MRLLLVVDVDVSANRLPPPSLGFSVPAPRAFEDTTPVEVLAGTAASLASSIAAAPTSRESAKAAWLAFVSHRLYERLKLLVSYGTATMAERAKFLEWQLGLSSGGV